MTGPRPAVTGERPDERPHRLDLRDDRGVVGGAEVIPFGLVVFVAGTLLLANAWAVVDAKFAVDAAAREAVRVLVESDGSAAANQAAAERAAEVVAGYGRRPERLELSPPSFPGGGGFHRCGVLSVEASYPVPAVTLPFIGGFGNGFWVSARHSELIDPYRSGLTGGVGC